MVAFEMQHCRGTHSNIGQILSMNTATLLHCFLAPFLIELYIIHKGCAPIHTSMAGLHLWQCKFFFFFLFLLFFFFFLLKFDVQVHHHFAAEENHAVSKGNNSFELSAWK